VSEKSVGKIFELPWHVFREHLRRMSDEEKNQALCYAYGYIHKHVEFLETP
jgi:hypothetical protein